MRVYVYLCVAIIIKQPRWFNEQTPDKLLQSLRVKDPISAVSILILSIYVYITITNNQNSF